MPLLNVDMQKAVIQLNYLFNDVVTLENPYMFGKFHGLCFRIW